MTTPDPGHVTVFAFRMEVPRDLPTPNQRLPWPVRAERVRRARQLVELQAQRHLATTFQGAALPGKMVALHLTLGRGKGQRLLDADNVTGTLKPVLDALRDAGWLVNDNPRNLPSDAYDTDQSKSSVLEPWVDVSVSVQMDPAYRRYVVPVINQLTGDIRHFELEAPSPAAARQMACTSAFRELGWRKCSASQVFEQPDLIGGVR